MRNYKNHGALLLLLMASCNSSHSIAAKQDLKNIAGKEIGVDVSKFIGPMLLADNIFRWYRIVPGDTLFIEIEVNNNIFEGDLIRYGSHSKNKLLGDFPLVNER